MNWSSLSALFTTAIYILTILLVGRRNASECWSLAHLTKIGSWGRVYSFFLEEQYMNTKMFLYSAITAISAWRGPPCGGRPAQKQNLWLNWFFSDKYANFPTSGQTYELTNNNPRHSFVRFACEVCCWIFLTFSRATTTQMFIFRFF